jgi:hypothetical protein
VKLFPASLADPSYLPALGPLLPSLRLLVTAGSSPTASGRGSTPARSRSGSGASSAPLATVGEAEVERRCRAALAAAA